MIRVCFVCLGNICRSPTAEAVFLDLIERRGIAAQFVVDSAGTGDWHVGERAHPDTRAAAKRRGVEVRSIARQFIATDFAKFDYVLAMDASNRTNLLRIAKGDDAGKVHLFRDFDPSAARGSDVPDPYYTGTFDEVFDICLRAAEGFLGHVQRERGGAARGS
ncbi:MAG: low molecular weight protein-tyrosine-phosphatase [Sandaracinaceae bacterium]